VSHTPEELLIVTLADMLRGDRHVAVGAASPIPGAAALLAKSEAKHRNHGRMHVSILHSLGHNPFTEGARELFDAAGQGRIDTFFLGGVQIDGRADINLVGIGDYPKLTRRFAGSFGSALMYFAVPRVILFREEHSPRTLVERVDFISAPGTSPPEVWRRGGPKALVTGKAVFSFDSGHARFRLESVHGGETPETVAAATGFGFEQAPGVAETPAPSTERLKRLRRDIAPQIAEFYPRFAARVWGLAA